MTTTITKKDMYDFTDGLPRVIGKHRSNPRVQGYVVDCPYCETKHYHREKGLQYAHCMNVPDNTGGYIIE